MGLLGRVLQGGLPHGPGGGGAPITARTAAPGQDAREVCHGARHAGGPGHRGPCTQPLGASVLTRVKDPKHFRPSHLKETSDKGQFIISGAKSLAGIK